MQTNRAMHTNIFVDYTNIQIDKYIQHYDDTMPTNLTKPFRIELYRDIFFDYTSSKLQGSTTTSQCNCSCGNGGCSPVDKLFYYSKPTDPIGEIYNQLKAENYTELSTYAQTKGTDAHDTTVNSDFMEWDVGFKAAVASDKASNMANITEFKQFKSQDEGEYAVADDLLQVDNKNDVYDDTYYLARKHSPKPFSPECQVCNNTQSFITGFNQRMNRRVGNGIKGFASEQKILFENFFNEYNALANKESATIENMINQIQTKQSVFNTQSKQIVNLKKKIEIAHTLLDAQADKLKAFNSQISNLKAQNQQRTQKGVALKLPFMGPIYTVTSKNYLILMIILNIVLCAIIVVYGFRQQTKLTGDISAAA